MVPLPWWQPFNRRLIEWRVAWGSGLERGQRSLAAHPFRGVEEERTPLVGVSEGRSVSMRVAGELGLASDTLPHTGQNTSVRLPRIQADDLVCGVYPTRHTD